MADHGERTWDREAFWYPTRDITGMLLAIFLILSALRFDELFGLHNVETMLFGFWPTTFGYQVGMSVLHIGFAYLLYRYWPDPAEDLELGGAAP